MKNRYHLIFILLMLMLFSFAVVWGQESYTTPNNATEDVVETSSIPNIILKSGYEAPLTGSRQDLLYDNGPLVNSPGTGVGGADESVLQSVSLGMNTLGFGHQIPSDNRMADDFTVSDPGGWYADSLVFYAYQTNSPTTSTITDVRYQIWDGNPSDSSSTVVFGDLTTNRMIYTTWSNIYRVSETTTGTSTARPIMKSTVSAGVFLPPGTYWVEWFGEGSLSSGPWAPPVTITGTDSTGNAWQFSSGNWHEARDSGSNGWQGLPFLIYGVVLPPPSNLPFTESFEDTSLVIPDGWVQIDADGGDEVPGADWTNIIGAGSPLPAYDGDAYCFINYQAANAQGVIDEWLITPQLQNYQSGMELSFYLNHVDDIWDDSLMVLVSTTGMDPADFTMIDYINSPVTWTEFTYDLGNYGVSAGDSIYIAFRYLHFDGGSFGTHSNFMGLDLVKVDYPFALTPPQNLTATAGANTVDLMWEAPLPPGATELAYDDGTDEGNISIGSTAEGDLAVRFTPNVYPSTILAIKVHFADVAGAMTSIDWTIWDGNTTGPGTSLATGTQATNRGVFDVIDVSASAVQITADDFFISYFEPNGQTMNLSWDTDQPSADRSWVNAPTLGLPWQTSGTIGPTFDNNYMIRAIVQEGTGPNARVVELSPNGESRPLTITEIKEYRQRHNLNSVASQTGAFSFDGSHTAVNPSVRNEQKTLERPVSGKEIGSPLSLAKLSNGYSVEGLTGYNIYRSENGTNFNNIANVDSATTNYTDVGLTSGTDYWYYVTAVYQEGESGPSDTVMVTTSGCTQAIANHETPEYRTAVTNEGTIGMLNAYGGLPGFEWPLGLNQLFEGALMVGIAPDQVSDGARVISGGGQTVLDEDFMCVSDIDTLADNADSTVYFTSFNDNNHPNGPQADDGPNAPLPVEIHQTSYSYTDAANSGYIIFKLEVTNTGATALTGVLVGMYHDWDINSFGTNTGEVVFEDVTIPGVNGGNPFPAEFVRLYDAGNPFPLLGAVPLSQNVFRASRVASNANEIFPGGASPLTEANKYGYMLDRRATNPFGPLGTPEDQSLVVGVGGGTNDNPPDPGFDIGPGETVVVGIAIVGGNDAQDFVENGAAAMAKWVELGNELLILTPPVGIAGETEVLPTEFALEQNFPNPFNPTTSIKYALKENADVTLKIYNVLGQLVKTLVNEKQTAGFKTANWDGTNQVGAKVASGIYIYRLEANDFVQSRKMILMK